MSGLEQPDAGAREIRAMIERLEARRYTAMQAADKPALSDLLSDALVYAHSDGSRDSKDSYLANLGGALRYVRIEHPIELLLVSGNHALVHGTMRADVERDGHPKRLHNAYLAVWREEEAGWRLLAFQPTPLTS